MTWRAHSPASPPAPPPAPAASVARAFGTLAAARPVSPPATNGSGTAAAAFLFGDDHAGDGTPVDERTARAMQAAAAIDMDDDAIAAARAMPRAGAHRHRAAVPRS